MSGCPDGFDCSKIHELLDDIVDEELAADVYDWVVEHLQKCPDCTLHVDSVKKVIRLFREADEKRAPVHVQLRLKDVLARAREMEGGN
jgi:predicted anti-sigma-YlaC factor YlaD